MPAWNEAVWFAVFLGVALKSAALLGAAWMAARLLRKPSAAARHLVWTAAAAGVVALPLLSISMPALPVPGAGALMAGAGVMFRATAVARGAAAADPASRAPAEAPGKQERAGRIDWRLCAMLLWAAGAALAFARTMAAWLEVRRMRRAARPWPDQRLLLELARELGIARKVEALEAGEGAMPMTCGVFRPAVFLPPAARAWSEERRRIVVLHELAHVRRADAATQLLARIALNLNWWNPLAWTAWSAFLTERERAADDLVLRAGARAADYAGHLLDVARASQAAPLGWAAVAMARPSQLEGRLGAILDAGVNRKPAGRMSALAAALAAVAIVAPLAAVRAQENAPAIPVDLDGTIRAAIAQKNYEMLEKPAAAFAALQQYDPARKLLDSAAGIRQEVSGAQSVDYGLGLMKIAELEKRRGNSNGAEEFYKKALAAMGERAESAPALMYQGLRRKNPEEAMDDFERAQRLDPALAGPASMWMALIRERQQRPGEAEALYQTSLAAERADSADAENTLRLYGRFLKEQGRESEAAGVLDRAEAARKSLVREGTPRRRKAEGSPTALRVGNGVTPPSVLSKSEPQYTDEARAAKYAGSVVIAVEIFPDGTAQNIEVIKGLGLGLDERAVEAIRRWRFKPGTRDGAPVTVAAHVEVNFRLL